MVTFAGDGDFLMNGQELATASRYGAQGAQLVIIVVDNGMYGTIRMHQEREYPGRVSRHRPGQPRLRGARAGLWLCAGERVDRTAEFEPALLAALARGRPALIDLARPRRDHQPDDAARRSAATPRPRLGTRATCTAFRVLPPVS